MKRPAAHGIVTALIILGMQAAAYAEQLPALDLSDPAVTASFWKTGGNEAVKLVPVESGKLADSFAEPAPADLERRKQKALELLNEGEQLFYRLKPRQAIDRLKQSLEILLTVHTWTLEKKDIERAHLLLGATYQAMGMEKDALGHFRSVLLLSPSFKPDETRFNPLVIEMFERLAGKLRSELRGSLTIVSRPEGAEAWVDGRSAGKTPQTVVDLAAGKHLVVLAAPGHRRWFGIVEVRPGEDTRQEVFLQRASSYDAWRAYSNTKKVGVEAASDADAALLARHLKVKNLLLVSVAGSGTERMLSAALVNAGSGRKIFLGKFAPTGEGKKELLSWCAAALSGSPLPPHELEVAARNDGKRSTTPPPAPTPWWRTWWFWTAVSVVAGAAAGTTAVLLTRDSGYRLEVWR